MKRRNTNDHTLESFRSFPYVAWALFIGFSLFLYSLVMQLQAAAIELEIQSDISKISIPTVATTSPLVP